MKIIKSVNTTKESEILKDIEDILREKVTELKSLPIEYHNNCWEYDNFNVLKYHEQLEIAYEELFGEVKPEEGETIENWYIEP